jgi:ParB family chromosome partitioning protein
MPKLDDIKKGATNKTFKKREYRPYYSDGQRPSHIVQDVSNAPEANESIDNNLFYDSMIEVDPNLIKNWEYHDRPENELGDIDALANEFKEIGQQQPCIVRPIQNNPSYQYELIAGERRWRAAQVAKIKLKVIIKKLSDNDAAIVQASENNNRLDLSEYARGMSYFNLIEKGIITQKELSEKLNISKQQVSRLLSFSKIPQEIINSISDLSKITARTAEQIKQLSSKGEQHIKAIISLSDRLRNGEIGQEKLQILVEKSINKVSKESDLTNKLYSKNGRHLFTWRQDNNRCPSIHFPKDIAQLLDNNKLDPKELSYQIIHLMEKLLMNINSESPAGDEN